MAGKIFTKPDGTGIKFYMIPCKHKRTITELIDKHGGLMSPARKDADYRLYNPGDIVSDALMVSRLFVEDSVKEGRLLDAEQYRYPKMAKKDEMVNKQAAYALPDIVFDDDDHGFGNAQPDKAGQQAKIQRTSGRHYNKSEDMAIIRAVIKDSKYHSINGNVLWENMQRRAVIDRSAQSMKERFIKKILPYLHLYDLSPTEKRWLSTLSAAKTEQVSNERGISARPRRPLCIDLNSPFDYSDHSDHIEDPSDDDDVYSLADTEPPSPNDPQNERLTSSPIVEEPPATASPKDTYVTFPATGDDNLYIKRKRRKVLLEIDVDAGASGDVIVQPSEKVEPAQPTPKPVPVSMCQVKSTAAQTKPLTIPKRDERRPPETGTAKNKPVVYPSTQPFVIGEEAEFFEHAALWPTQMSAEKDEDPSQQYPLTQPFTPTLDGDTDAESVMAALASVLDQVDSQPLELSPISPITSSSNAKDDVEPPPFTEDTNLDAALTQTSGVVRDIESVLTTPQIAAQLSSGESMFIQPRPVSPLSQLLPVMASTQHSDAERAMLACESIFNSTSDSLTESQLWPSPANTDDSLVEQSVVGVASQQSHHAKSTVDLAAATTTATHAVPVTTVVITSCDDVCSSPKPKPAQAEFSTSVSPTVITGAASSQSSWSSLGLSSQQAKALSGATIHSPDLFVDSGESHDKTTPTPPATTPSRNSVSPKAADTSKTSESSPRTQNSTMSKVENSWETVDSFELNSLVKAGVPVAPRRSSRLKEVLSQPLRGSDKTVKTLDEPLESSSDHDMNTSVATTTNTLVTVYYDCKSRTSSNSDGSFRSAASKSPGNGKSPKQLPVTDTVGDRESTSSVKAEPRAPLDGSTTSRAERFKCQGLKQRDSSTDNKCPSISGSVTAATTGECAWCSAPITDGVPSCGLHGIQDCMMYKDLKNRCTLDERSLTQLCYGLSLDWVMIEKHLETGGQVGRIWTCKDDNLLLQTNTSRRSAKKTLRQSFTTREIVSRSRFLLTKLPLTEAQRNNIL